MTHHEPSEDSAAQKPQGDIDPSLIAGNVVHPVRLDSETVADLKSAFDYEAANTWVLHADERSAGAAAEFAQVTTDILAELNGETFEEGQKPRVLGGLASTSDTAYKFHSLTQKNFAALGERFAEGESLELAADSPLAEQIRQILEKQQEETAKAQAERTEILKGTYLDGETPEGVATVELQVGTPLRIDLDAQPLLDEEQTYEAFFTKRRTDIGGVQVEGFRGTVVANVDIDGGSFVIVDTRDAAKGWPGTGRRTKTGNGSYKGESKAGQIKVLQIVGEKEDPRFGVEVSEQNFDFESKYSRGAQPVYGVTERTEKSRGETGIFIDIDNKGRLAIGLGQDTATATITAAEGAIQELTHEKLTTKEAFEHQVKELKKRLNDSMPGGKSRFAWAPDLLTDLDRIEKKAKQEDQEPTGEVVVTTSTSLENPDTWRNQNGEMDAVNLFLGNVGAVSRDHVLREVQTKVYKEMNTDAYDGKGGEGEIEFQTNTPGVRTKIKYGYSSGGTIKYIRPQIVMDPTVEVAA